MQEKILVNRKYRPLWEKDKKWRYAIISGGRGSGKSFASQLFLRDLTYEPWHKILSTRYTMDSAKTSVIPEFSGKLELTQSPYSAGAMIDDFSLVENTYTNIRSKSELRFSGIKTSSGIQTAKLKSIEGLTTWYLEEAEEMPCDGTDTEASTFDKIDDSIRKKGIPLRTILSWNPNHTRSFVYQRFFAGKGDFDANRQPTDLPITFNGVRDNVLYIYTTYQDNIKNLAEDFLYKARQIKDTNLARYNHIYLGLPLSENANALWKMATMIEPFRVSVPPAEFKRIVVSIDPSVTSTGKQDECGIVIAGMDFKGHYYIIDDLSGLYTPAEWGRVAIGAYKKYKCDNIIAEGNQGGDLVKLNIRNVSELESDRNIPVKMVNARRGKILRAEPISALYEEGKVHHLKYFHELELELTTYTGADNEKSPGRLDATVWGLTELSGQNVPEVRARIL